MINASDVRKTMKQREIQKLKIFDQLVEKCCRNIRRIADVGRDQSYDFRVPSFEFGTPLFDQSTARSYIVEKLTSMGYRVNHIGGDRMLLRVSWGQQHQFVPAVTHSVTYSNMLPSPRYNETIVRSNTQNGHYITRPHILASSRYASSHHYNKDPDPLPSHTFPPPNQWLSSKLLDSYRDKLPHKIEEKNDDIIGKQYCDVNLTKKRSGKYKILLA